MDGERRDGGGLYFRTIREVSAKVNDYVQDAVRGLGLSPQLESELLRLPQKRKGAGIMRSNLTYLLYRNLGGSASVGESVPGLAISELSNCHCYLDNWVFDNKNNCCADRNALAGITTASAILRELAQMAIHELDVTDATKIQISKSLAEVTIHSYHGQALDLGTSTANLHDFASDDAFLEHYSKRGLLLSGRLYGFSAELGALLAGKDWPDAEVAKKFGETLGSGIQASNDLGDFALFFDEGSFRSYQDQLSDVIEGRLTLPIYYTMRYGSEGEKASLNNLIGKKHASSNEEKLLASKAILSSGAYSRSRLVLNSYRRKLKQTVRQLPQNEYRDALSSMAQTVCCNKYLTALKKVGDFAVIE